MTGSLGTDRALPAPVVQPDTPRLAHIAPIGRPSTPLPRMQTDVAAEAACWPNNGLSPLPGVALTAGPSTSTSQAQPDMAALAARSLNNDVWPPPKFVLPAGSCVLAPQAQPDVATLAEQALYNEVWLAPKPGLVDSLNNGAHSDMDLPLFLRSIGAITPWLREFVTLGTQLATSPPTAILASIRPAGIACEQAMFTATDGVNTHKGGIFAFGLLCTAAGRLTGRNEPITQAGICREVATLCAGIVERELQACRHPATLGERLFLQHGLTGARGEAQSGFATVRRHVLPYWHQERHPTRRLLHALLLLMAYNNDTNLVARGGLNGLHYVQRYARHLLSQGFQLDDLHLMDQQLIKRNLSPGGSADLLAVSWLLAALPA